MSNIETELRTKCLNLSIASWQLPNIFLSTDRLDTCHMILVAQKFIMENDGIILVSQFIPLCSPYLPNNILEIHWWWHDPSPNSRMTRRSWNSGLSSTFPTWPLAAFAAHLWLLDRLDPGNFWFGVYWEPTENLQKCWTSQP
jgi:hypothetical protein